MAKTYVIDNYTIIHETAAAYLISNDATASSKYTKRANESRHWIPKNSIVSLSIDSTEYEELPVFLSKLPANAVIEIPWWLARRLEFII